MNWFKKIVLKWVSEGDNLNSGDHKKAVDRSIQSDETADWYNEYINVEIAPAVGGRILKIKHRKTRHNNGSINTNTPDRDQLYIIPTGEDVGERVSRIINMELMKS